MPRLFEIPSAHAAARPMSRIRSMYAAPASGSSRIFPTSLGSIVKDRRSVPRTGAVPIERRIPGTCRRRSSRDPASPPISTVSVLGIPLSAPRTAGPLLGVTQASLRTAPRSLAPWTVMLSSSLPVSPRHIHFMILI